MPKSVTPALKKSTNVRTTSASANPLRLRLARTGLRLAHRVAPRALEKVAFTKFRTPRRFPRPQREQGWLATARRFDIPTVPLPGSDPDAPRRLAAWSWGEGPAVLLVHGWEGRGSQMAAVAQPLVEAGHRVVAFDAPAHGETGGRLSSLPELAHAIRAAADACGPLHGLVAHSFGCAGSALAVQAGLDTERLVFLATPDDFGGYLLATVRGLGLPDSVYDHVVASIEDRFDVRWEEVRRITVDAATDKPLLVVHDHGDAETPFAGGERVALAWPSSRLLATDGLGHRRILRDDTVVREVGRFLTAARSSLLAAS